MRLYLQNNQSKKGWRHGSSSRANTKSKFKPQYHQKKKKVSSQTKVIRLENRWHSIPSTNIEDLQVLNKRGKISVSKELILAVC
jgi:hypothetical protein